MSRSRAARAIPTMTDENLPAHRCAECWFYEPDGIDDGECHALPPSVVGDETVRPTVDGNDRGCLHFKPRHRA